MTKLTYNKIDKKYIPDILRHIPFGQYNCYYTNLLDVYLTDYNCITKEKCADYEKYMIFKKKRTWYYMPVHANFLNNDDIDKESFVLAMKKRGHNVFMAPKYIRKIKQYFSNRMLHYGFIKLRIGEKKDILSKIKIKLCNIGIYSNALMFSFVKTIYKL